MKSTCPKCETKLRSDAARCPVCGTPLALAGFRPDPERRAEPVLDPMLDLFDRDQKVPVCPECLAEFREDIRRCRHCNQRLDRVLRKDYLRRLDHRPIRDLGRAIAAGPPKVPADLVRVHVAHGLDECEALLRELAFVGLEPWPGSDSLDPIDEPGAIGLYVHQADLEAARYLVTAWSPSNPLDLPPGAEEAAASGRTPLQCAQEWVGFGKYREALRVLEEAGNDGPAAILRVEAELRAGQVREAGRLALIEAARDEFDAVDRGRLLARAGIIAALGPDGTPFDPRADLEEAREWLEHARDLAPRYLDGGKALVEVLHHSGARESLVDELRRLDRFCPNLFGHAGPFREIMDHAMHGIRNERPFGDA